MRADPTYVGIEDVTARVREIQAMTQGVAPDAAVTSPTSADPAQAAAFTSQLEAQMLLGAGGAGGAGVDPSQLPGAAGQVGMGGLPVISAEQLLQAQGLGGSGALGVQGLLAGMQPAMAAAPTGPTRLSGDLDGLDPGLRRGLEQVAAAIGQEIDVISGHRSYEEQSALYQKYLNGTGNLAARPGTSNHESGNAADVYVNGVALQNVPGAAEAAKAAGLGFPVGGEPWHVERV